MPQYMFFPSPSSGYRVAYDEPPPSPVPSGYEYSDSDSDADRYEKTGYEESDETHGNPEGSISVALDLKPSNLHLGLPKGFKHRTLMSTSELSLSAVSLSAVVPATTGVTQRRKRCRITSPVSFHTAFESDSDSDYTFGGSNDMETDAHFWQNTQEFLESVFSVYSPKSAAPIVSKTEHAPTCCDVPPNSLGLRHALSLEGKMDGVSTCEEIKSQATIPSTHPFASRPPEAAMGTSLPTSFLSSMPSPSLPPVQMRRSHSDESTASQITAVDIAGNASSGTTAMRLPCSNSNTTARIQSTIRPPPFSAPLVPVRWPNLTLLSPVPTLAASQPVSPVSPSDTTILTPLRADSCAKPCCFFEFSDDETNPRPRATLSLGWLGRRRSSKDKELGQHVHIHEHKHRHEHVHTHEYRYKHKRSSSSVRSEIRSPRPPKTPLPKHRVAGNTPPSPLKTSPHYIIAPSELSRRKPNRRPPPPLDLRLATHAEGPVSVETCHEDSTDCSSPRVGCEHSRGGFDRSSPSRLNPTKLNPFEDDEDAEQFLAAPFEPSAWTYERDGFTMPTA